MHHALFWKAKESKVNKYEIVNSVKYRDKLKIMKSKEKILNFSGRSWVTNNSGFNWEV